MRATLARIVAIGMAATACTSPNPTGPTVQNGVVLYADSRVNQNIACDGRPIQLSGNRTEIRLTGPCQFVRLTGEHNDIWVDLVPGGTFEITGGHNDVRWRQIQPGPRPVLVDRGESNTFHSEGF
jgi:hypothetical protein